MNVYTEVIANIYESPHWQERLSEVQVEYIDLDQWTAQKSRFLAKSVLGNEYAIALKRNQQVENGDVIVYQPKEKRAVVIRVELNPVMVVDLSAVVVKDPETLARTAVELGHALGNQHWPAVVKNNCVYVPLTVDRKVMSSVMRTHHIEGITFSFQPGQEVIPYLAPHEIRRLFGGAGRENTAHGQAHEIHGHGHSHPTARAHE